MNETDRPLSKSAKVPLALLVIAVFCAWASATHFGTLYQAIRVEALHPFVIRQVLLVHLLGVLPLVACVAWALTALVGTSRIVIYGNVVLGLVVAWLYGWFDWSLLTNAGEATSVEQSLVRLLVAGGLELPWLVAAMAICRRDQQFSGFKWIDWVICALFAALPSIHVQQVIERRAVLLDESLRNQQLVTARDQLEPLAMLGCARVGEHEARPLLSALQEQIGQLQRAVTQPLPQGATASQRLNQARQLYYLARTDDVRDVLAPLAGKNVEAEIRLGANAEVQRRWDAAAEHFQVALDLLRETREQGTLSDDDLRLVRVAFERRVNNLRRTGQGQQAEHELQAALEDWPEVRDALLLQLGLHYHMAGRPAEATDYLNRAAEANPAYEERVQSELDSMSSEASSCFIKPLRTTNR